MKRSPMPQRKTPIKRTAMAKSGTRLPARRSRPRRTPVVRDGAWLAIVHTIPCVHCGNPVVQAAHRDYGKGGSQKTDDCATAALCAPEHHELTDGTKYSRDEKRARMDRYIVDTLIQLVRAGKVGVIE